MSLREAEIVREYGLFAGADKVAASPAAAAHPAAMLVTTALVAMGACRGIAALARRASTPARDPSGNSWKMIEARR